MSSEDSYPKTPLNTVNRYRPRGKYDYHTINTIIDSCPVLHVAFNPPTPPSKDDDDNNDDDPAFPVILPMIGCTGSFATPDAPTNTARDIYLHGYVSSRMMRQPATTAEGGDDDDDDDEGLAVSIAATHVDGVVLALTPHNHSVNFRSAVAFGRARRVTDAAEKLYALQLLTDNVVAGRWAGSRVPPTRAEMTATAVLRVRVRAASAKLRAGTTGEDRADLKDDAVRARVWAGVVPAWTQWGAPVPAPTNLVADLPAYVEAWRAAANEGGREHAVAAAGAAYGKPK